MSEEIYVDKEGALESAQSFETEKEAMADAKELASDLEDEISSWEGEAATQAKLSAQELSTQLSNLTEGIGMIASWITSGTQLLSLTDDAAAESMTVE